MSQINDYSLLLEPSNPVEPVVTRYLERRGVPQRNLICPKKCHEGSLHMALQKSWIVWMFEFKRIKRIFKKIRTSWKENSFVKFFFLTLMIVVGIS